MGERLTSGLAQRRQYVRRKGSVMSSANCRVELSGAQSLRVRCKEFDGIPKNIRSVSRRDLRSVEK